MVKSHRTDVENRDDDRNKKNMKKRYFGATLPSEFSHDEVLRFIDEKNFTSLCLYASLLQITRYIGLVNPGADAGQPSADFI